MPTISTYRVVAGDTLFKIAAKFSMGVDDLKSLNGLTSNNLSIGQTLKVRVAGNAPAPTPAPTPAPPVNSGGATYRVVAGDSLFKIASKFGMTVDELKALNGLTSTNLSIGQTLKVRGSGGSNIPTPTPTPIPTPTPQPPVFNGSGGSFQAARQEFIPEVVQDAGFRRYIMRARVAGGGLVVASMRDNVNSIHTVFPDGITYAGQSQLALDALTIQSLGVTPQVVKALQYVSSHEGQFDAINSYDKAIFSYGFIQFTGSTTVGGSLNRVLTSMEINAPQAFQRIFQRVGIDTEGGVVTVIDNNGNKLRGDDAWLFIQRDVRLYGPFIQAGFEPALVKEQVRMANELFVQPILNFKFDVMIGGIRISIPRLRDVITSEAALTAAIALGINKGAGGMSKIFATSIGNVATRSGISSSQALANINEMAVIQDIAATNSTDPRTVNRMNGVLNSGMSFV